MASLVMLSPAPLIEAPGGEVVLDVKFVEGMKLHCQLWPGPVRCLMRRGALHIDAPMRYSLAQLGFDLIVLDPGAPVPELLLDEAALVYVAADDMKYLHLPDAMRGRMGKLVYTVEDPLSARIANAFAISTSVRRRLGSTWWNLRQERALRHALRGADAVHCNGYPVHEAYRRLNPRVLRYLDNRMRSPMIGRADELAARAVALRRNDPLRLAWFGMLDAQSGVMDLVRMAHLLNVREVPFTLSLFGTGPLEQHVRDGIAGMELKDRMSLEPMAAFDPVLVRRLRREADMFVSPRRLSSPSSTYVEALGCGLPILGYGNRMWQRMQRESGAGWAVRRGSVGGLVETVARLDGDRESLIAAAARATDFARMNAFETVFARRMNDLRDLAGLD